MASYETGALLAALGTIELDTEQMIMVRATVAPVDVSIKLRGDTAFGKIGSVPTGEVYQSGQMVAPGIIQVSAEAYVKVFTPQV